MHLDIRGIEEEANEGRNRKENQQIAGDEDHGLEGNKRKQGKWGHNIVRDVWAWAPWAANPHPQPTPHPTPLPTQTHTDRTLKRIEQPPLQLTWLKQFSYFQWQLTPQVDTICATALWRFLNFHLELPQIFKIDEKIVRFYFGKFG